MHKSAFILPAAVREAFASFAVDASTLALPLTLANGTLQPSPTIRPSESPTSFQAMLNDLNAAINPRTPLYLLLRRNDRLFAITFVPYLAKEGDRTALLKHRQDLVQLLGDKHFSHSLVCKEIGEITDARSWTERDEDESPVKLAPIHVGGTIPCNDESCKNCAMKDVGYKRNRCRLCDRRMKNKIAPDATEALQSLKNPGTIVQISVDITTELLSLKLSQPHTQPGTVASLLPTIQPSFTLYHHPTNWMMYFIFHSPDTATVQQRMKHTMAIPGLLVHAEDAGVRVDRKIEIHDPDDLVFEESKDERVGRFRSVYRREGFNGTELMYEGMARDKEFLDAL